MKQIHFHPDAESEMIASADFYETAQRGLGKRFLTSVKDALNRIAIDPLLYPAVDRDVKRCLIKTFPFGVLFRNQPDTIVIVAVMHLYRDPNYWKNR
jgi:toxin ParE1/3/4